MKMKLVVLAVVFGFVLFTGVRSAHGQQATEGGQQWVPYAGVAPYPKHVVSPPVESLPQAPGTVGGVTQIPLFHRPSFLPSGQAPATDQALQAAPGSTLSASSGTGFAGIGYNGYYPPDPNLSVGATQIVQTTNVEFAIYDKAGNLLKGPVLINSLFGGLGGLCASTNGGDPIVLWDKIAGRWLISQLAYNSSFTQDNVCVAISRSADATGAFNVYGFSFSHLTDYPKFGVWASSSASGQSDYYLSANLFSTAAYYGPVVCALNGSDMQSGAAARYACAQGGTNHFSLLPSDLDGSTAPATGEPNYFVELGTGSSGTAGNSLIMFPFLATWTSSGGSVSTVGGTTIYVDSYSQACSNGGTCIPQPGTSKQLDSLGDRLMYRLAWRNINGYESLVANHSVDEGNGVVGIRWYEIRSNVGSTLATSQTVSQQGTFLGGDSNYRWMGSIAQDRAGDIALGYSISNGSSRYPSINFTGRTPSDPAGTMETESTILSGLGAETSASRWGDYTSLSLDPSDDCTFWYTNEYFSSPSGGVSWKTWIAPLKFSSCSSTSTPDFSLSASPSSYTVFPGGSAPYTIGVNPLNGFTGTVNLTVSVPAGSGLTATLNPTSVTGGSGNSALTVATSNSTAAGNYTVTVTGTSGSLVHSASVTVAVTDFSMSASPASQSVTQGNSVPYTVTVTALNGFNGTVGLGASVAPSNSGITASFNPTSVTGSGSSTLTLSASSTTPPGSYTITITGTNTGGSPVHSTSVTLVVNAPVAGSFTVSASPSTRTVTRGPGVTALYTVAVTPSGGFTGSVTLSVSGLPARSSASFSPNPVSITGSTSANSTLTISISKKTQTGTFTLAITGTSGSLSSTASVTLIVQ